MKIFYDDNSTVIGILFDGMKECKVMVTIMDAALNGKKLNKQSAAYKLAKKIDDDLPVF